MTSVRRYDTRRALIASKRAQVTRLLVEVGSESLREQVLLAQRDLDEATSWLEHRVVETQARLLTIVDTTIQLASWRLIAVRECVERKGPTARLLD